MIKAKAHQKLPTDWSEREILRDKGQFWTPTWVAEAMIAYVSQETDLIFDPATGRGAFFEALLKLNKSKISFFGTDVDASVLSDDIYNHRSSDVELRDFIKNPPPRKFKAIVGNPPYIRHHRIDEKTKTFLKQLSLTKAGFIVDGRAGYHIYFLIQALNLLDKDGRLAFIMPADTCEGKFANELWKWISEKFCLEAVITFDSKATPFPNVDTNAIVFLIKNSKPETVFQWVKVTEPYSSELGDFVLSDFRNQNFETLEIVSRQLNEGIATGLSRPIQNQNTFKYCLSDFATVMRGIATGANEFFFLTAKQVKEIGLPSEFVKRAIGRTKDTAQNILTKSDIEQLDKASRPTYLFSINGHKEFPHSVIKYLKIGEDMKLPERPLIKQRKPWYKMEQREIPPILFAYLGRRNTRFILNEAKVVPLTGFICVYPNRTDEESVKNLWRALNDQDTLEKLSLVGKSYGSGAIKVEPGNLRKLPIPESVVEKYNLKKGERFEVKQPALFEV